MSFTRQGRCQERDDVLGTTKPPLSLAWTAGVLRAHGHESLVVDLTVSDPASAEKAIDAFRPTLIIFASCFPTWDADARAMAALKRRTGAPIVSFGPHASSAPLAAMARPSAADVDALIVGEPEDAACAIAGARSTSEWTAIDALCVRHGAEVRGHRAPGRFAGFVAAAGPDWRGVDFSRYRLPLVNAPYALVETSRGCPYTCDFCVAPLQQGHIFRERSAASVVDEIEQVRRERGVEYFYLWGDTVTLRQQSIGAIADELIRRRLGIRWIANARADNLTDAALVTRLRDSGCWMLSFGIEASAPERRDEMQKRLQERAIGAAIGNLRAVGIKSFAFFILGYPGETRESMQQTIDYACESGVDFAGFYPAVPYPGTALGDRASASGWLIGDDWRRLEYSHYVMRTGALDERSVMAAISRARRRFYLRPGYLARHAKDLARVALSKPSITARVLLKRTQHS